MLGAEAHSGWLRKPSSLQHKAASNVVRCGRGHACVPHIPGQSRNSSRFEIGAAAKPTADLREERISEHCLCFAGRGCCACILGTARRAWCLVPLRIYGYTEPCFDIRSRSLSVSFHTRERRLVCRSHMILGKSETGF